MQKLYFLLIILFIPLLSLNAQSSIMVNGRAQKGKILLRWAVDNPAAWQSSNKDGFIVYRLTIKKNGKLLDSPQKTTLAEVKAAPLADWQELAHKDNYAAIIAQAIYGESFEVGQEAGGSIAKIIGASDELVQRHSFSLFAADLSFEGAVKAGWGYVDTTAREGEVYAYQIAAKNIAGINPGAIMIGPEDFDGLPVIPDLIAMPDDKKTMLSWGVDRLRYTYTSYMVERSADGVSFTPVSTTPIVDINSNGEQRSKQMFFGDKLETNDRDYFYRVYGINSFGEKGPASAPVRVRGVASAAVAPRISNYSITSPDEVELSWEFPREEEKNISGFEVLLADKDNGEYKAVAKAVDKDKRSIRHKGLYSSNYFKVAVNDLQGRKIISQSTLVQPIDSIPPAKPAGLRGKIDSLGQVSLQWQPNVEKDLAGYRILRANTEHEDFVDIFNKNIPENSATDKVSFNISNSRVYYRVVAEDLRYNRSEFSDVLVIEKPDKVPPTAPVFKDYTTADGVNTLVWINSSSDDVDRYVLKRREKGQAPWVDIATFKNGEEQYSDDKAENDKTYEYLIQARDKSGLWSSPDASLLTFTTLNNRQQEVLRNVESSVDRAARTATLYWGYLPGYEVSELQIFKNKKGEKPTLWKVLDGKFMSVTDKAVEMNSEYEYYILPSLYPEKPTKGEKIILTF